MIIKCHLGSYSVHPFNWREVWIYNSGLTDVSSSCRTNTCSFWFRASNLPCSLARWIKCLPTSGQVHVQDTSSLSKGQAAFEVWSYGNFGKVRGKSLCFTIFYLHCVKLRLHVRFFCWRWWCAFSKMPRRQRAVKIASLASLAQMTRQACSLSRKLKLIRNFSFFFFFSAIFSAVASPVRKRCSPLWFRKS